jgi:hypothetical protein
LRPGRFFYGRFEPAFFRRAMKKGLAGEGKTLGVILKSWLQPRKTIKRA